MHRTVRLHARPGSLLAAIPIAILARLCLSSPAAIPHLLCADLALIAVAIAGIERRNAAMLAAAALSAGLCLFGLLLLPFVIAIAIQRRAGLRAVPPALLAGALGPACGHADARMAGASPTGLWAIADALPDHGAALTALLVAGLSGAILWHAAGMTIRPLVGTATLDTLLFATTGVALLAPVSADSLIAPLALAVASGRRRPAASIAATLMLAHLGLPALATLPLLVAVATCATVPVRRAANDNMPWRPRSVRLAA